MAGSTFRPPNPIVLGDVVREHLGQQLRGVYSDLIVSDLPPDLIRLIGRLESSIRIPEDGEHKELWGNTVPRSQNSHWNNG
jgi:RNA polymerase sigma-70 factor, ECF subfamily